ncbi:MAG: substrate-binding domain-containing protein, partial [Bauldia sp.]|nr:substrate-binding domain-containing protein [Bauldia sp.]
LIWQGAFTFEAGVRVARQFLAHPARPTAVFASSDEMAMGFIRTVKDAGLRVPDDVSVAGFDDIEFARYFDPALTTIHQPRAELGRLAAESLVARMTGNGRTIPLRTRLPCTLIVRDSVSAPRPAGRELKPSIGVAGARV